MARSKSAACRVVVSVALLLAAAAAAVSPLAGCGGASRPARSRAELMERRARADQRVRDENRSIVGKVVERTKRQYDDYAAGRRPAPPVIDLLVISGGGDWGAFGAGFLKGWARVPPGGELARPEFTAVTGVSTGALIAPFAFLGDDESIERINHLYRNPKPDWVKQRGPLYFLPNNISFAEVPGLERELKANVTRDMTRRIADAGADGRVLVVNTTDLDDGCPRVFDLVAEARRAADTGDMTRFHDVMLASSGIPGAFPFRVIDDELYVDGGVTGNIIYGGRLSEAESVTGVWHHNYPDLPIPRTRFWVIFNNQLRPPPQLTAPNWPAVVQRAIEMSTRAATVTALRHLLATSEIARLKHGAPFEVRIVAIPGDWTPPKPGVFVKETMNDLADLGERMGADPGSWMTELPPL